LKKKKNVSEQREITGDYGFSHGVDDDRRGSLIASIARHTCFVKLFKRALLVVLLILFGVVFLLPVFQQDRAGVRVAFSGVQESTTTIAKPIMKSPRYQGVDEKKQPYTVTASEAVQEDARTILLSTVMADMRFQDASWVMISAGRATMDIIDRTLLLRDRISINHDAGYEFYASQVRVDLNKGTAKSESVIEGQSPFGYIRADGFVASRNEKKLVLQGHVKVIIQPQKAKQ
jgi:lipopolysaccharide export system protein LptC